MATAGAVQGLNIGLGMQGYAAANIGNTINGITVGWTQVLGRNLLDGAAAGLINSAVTGAGVERGIQNGLLNGFLNTGASSAAGWIGTNTGDDATLNRFTAEIAHAIAGCAAGAARSGASSGLSAADGCSAGAIGAVVGHLASQFYNPDLTRSLDDTLRFGQMMAGIAGALVGGKQASADLAAGAGVNAVENNFGVLIRAAQLAQQVAVQGTGIVTAEGAILLQRCVASSACSVLMPASVIAIVIGSSRSSVMLPTGAAAIPGWPESGMGVNGLPNYGPPNTGSTTSIPSYGDNTGGDRISNPLSNGNVVNGTSIPLSDPWWSGPAIGGFGAGMQPAFDSLMFAKPPQNVEPITNSPQNSAIPAGWTSKPGRESGSVIYYPPGTDPANGGESIRVMPAGASAVPELAANGYWVWVRNRQPMDPSTGNPARERGDAHIPLPEK